MKRYVFALLGAFSLSACAQNPGASDTAAAATPATPAPAAPQREVRHVYVQPPQPLYECVRDDGSRYTSDSGEGNPRWVPIWTSVYLPYGGGHRPPGGGRPPRPLPPIAPMGSGAGSGSVSSSGGSLSISGGGPHVGGSLSVGSGSTHWEGSREVYPGTYTDTVAVELTF